VDTTKILFRKGKEGHENESEADYKNLHIQQ